VPPRNVEQVFCWFSCLVDRFITCYFMIDWIV
jgi:hypothetical protein